MGIKNGVELMKSKFVRKINSNELMICDSIRNSGKELVISRYFTNYRE